MAFRSFDPSLVAFLSELRAHNDRDWFAQHKPIVEKPRGWRNARDDKAFRQHFELAGDSLKRPPRGYDAEHPLVEDLKRKDFIAVTDLAHTDLYKRTIVDRTTNLITAATPFMRFLCKAVGVRF